MPQLVVAPTAVSVPEGGTATYTVRLTSAPAAPLTVVSTAGPGDTSITVTAGASLTFTPQNWQTTQTVTLAAAPDTDAVNGSRTITVRGPGQTPVAVVATEADTTLPPDPIVTPTQVFVPEGGSATVSVRFPSQPTSNVTITTTAGPGDPDLTICAGATLTITPANWNTIQTIRICAAEDADSVNGTRTFVLASAGLASVTILATEVDNDPPVAHVDNPFAGASGYVNPDWQSQVAAEADRQPAPLADQMRSVGTQPTAVWLDRIAAVTEGRGLAGHLDAALAQDAANGPAPVVVTLVLYNLPNRNCPAPGSGELTVAGNGLSRYRTEYIDRIRAVLARPEYANLRVAAVVEPDSLVTQITHASHLGQTTIRCIEAHQAQVYRDGIRYAVAQLSSLTNTFLYLDVASSGWLGWTDNFNAILNLVDAVLLPAQGGPGYDKIHGFATNVAAYVPTEEVFLPDPFRAVQGQPLWMSRFFDFNPRFDERDYAVDLQAAFVTRGCTGCGMLIDTSRNGWGGPERPMLTSTATDFNQYVNESRLDRRPSRFVNCNQVGAGLGARPTGVTGIAGVDAFVWAKPPGESDGVSQPGIIDEDNPFTVFNPECDPTRLSRYGGHPTNAAPGAPHAGHFFPAAFAELVRNAHPPVT